MARWQRPYTEGLSAAAYTVRGAVRSGGAALCSCERSSSFRCPESAPAAAWRADGPTRVWTILAHLQAHTYNRVATVKYFLETIILLILIDGHNQIKKIRSIFKQQNVHVSYYCST